MKSALHNSSEAISRFFVHDRDRLVPVCVDDIVRLEADDDYTAIHAEGKRHLVSITLHDFERRLNPLRFRRVHRSTIVNLDHICSIEQQDRRLLLRLSDGTEVLASRTGSQNLKS